MRFYGPGSSKTSDTWMQWMAIEPLSGDPHLVHDSVNT